MSSYSRSSKLSSNSFYFLLSHYHPCNENTSPSVPEKNKKKEKKENKGVLKYVEENEENQFN